MRVRFENVGKRFGAHVALREIISVRGSFEALWQIAFAGVGKRGVLQRQHGRLPASADELDQAVGLLCEVLGAAEQRGVEDDEDDGIAVPAEWEGGAAAGAAGEPAVDRSVAGA